MAKRKKKSRKSVKFEQKTKRVSEDVRDAAAPLLAQCPEEDLEVLREHTADLFSLAFGG